MGRPFPRKCATCRERAVQPVTLPACSTSVDHDGRSYSITLADVGGTRCDRCGALILDDAVGGRIDDQLRELAGLLRPTEIRSKRQHLGLSQKELARRLQIGEATLSRWETGAQIQQRSLDLLLRLHFDLPEVRRFVGGAAPAQCSLSTLKNPANHIDWTKNGVKLAPFIKSGVPWLAQDFKQSTGVGQQQTIRHKTNASSTKPDFKLAV